jgi:hypothetical protein
MLPRTELDRGFIAERLSRSGDQQVMMPEGVYGLCHEQRWRTSGNYPPIRLNPIARTLNDPGPDVVVKLSRSRLGGSAVPSNGDPAQGSAKPVSG